MATIYKTTDRVAIKIGDITVKIAPLSMIQKSNVQSVLIEAQKANDIQKANEALLLSLKYCVKEIKGLQDTGGNDYQLQFENNELTDSCISDLMNMEHGNELLQACAAFVAGIPKSFDNIPGVSFAETAGKKKKRE